MPEMMTPTARRALEFMADPGNWIGDPDSQQACLTGHDTPFELACQALADNDMSALHIYGASDDLMEIEGDIPGCDEYNGEKGVFVVAGVRLDMAFTEGGVWTITVGPIDEDVPVTVENIRIEVEGHSAHLYMDVPEGSYVMQSIKAGN